MLYAGYCAQRDLQSAWRLLEEMEALEEEHMHPNDVSYNSLINCAVSVGRLRDAWSLVQRMESKGIQPDRYFSSTAC